MQPIKPEAFLPSRSEQDQQQQGDPYEQIIHLLSATRENLVDISDGLARRQDEIGALRVAAYQKPAVAEEDTRLLDDVLSDVINVLWPEYPTAEQDDNCTTQAKAAILATLSPVAALTMLEAGVDPTRQEKVWAQARTLWAKYAGDPIGATADADRTQEIPRPAEAGFRQQSAAEGMYAKVAAGEVMDRAQAAREPQCAEGRYDTRGDCDGRMWCGELNRPMNDLPAGTKVYLCVSHMRQAQAVGEVAAGAIPVNPDPDPEAQCAETRYDGRGDCDGRMVEAITTRHNVWEGVPIGKPVILCQSHWEQCYRSDETGFRQLPTPDSPEEEVILREGVVVHSGDTLVLSYPEGTKATKVLADLGVLRAAMPEEARVTFVTGAALTVIRCDDGEV